MSAKVQCKQCGGNLEKERADWATPVCFACLPPPAPLPVVWPKSFAKALAEARAEGIREGLRRAARQLEQRAGELRFRYGFDAQPVVKLRDFAVEFENDAREVKP